MKWISLLLLFFSFNAQAADPSIELIAGISPELNVQVNGKKTSIQASSCKDAMTEAKKFCKNTQNPAVKLKCSAERKGLKSVEVTQCIPKQFRPFINQLQRESDANCWGSALYASGVNEDQLSATIDLFVLNINSPLCRRLGVNEAPQFGDVIRMFWPTGWKDDFSCSDHEELLDNYCDVHGISYAGPNLVFSKKNVGKDSRWNLASRSVGFQEYDVTAECQNVDRAQLPKTCENKPWAESYRCSSFESYLEKNKNSKGMNEILEARELLKGVKKIQQDLIWTNRVLPQFSEISDSGKVLNTVARSYCRNWVHPESGKTYDFRYGYQNAKEIVELRKTEKNPVFWSMLLLCQDAQYIIFPNELRYPYYLDSKED